MRFGPVPLDQAEGAVLAHSLPVAEGRLRKGTVLGAADLARWPRPGIER
jgi:molybdenum cofactor cytidylyltransferase